MTPRLLAVGQTDSVLRSVTGLNVVLVGGQALNHWCERYSETAAELASEVFTSKDIDFQGSSDDLAQTAQRLEGIPSFAAKHDWPFLGRVQFDPGDGQGLANVDFLIAPLGLSSEEVASSALPIAIGEVQLQVMHPIHCMMSRVANVIEKPKTYDTVHGMKQLRASIVCVREYIRARASVHPRLGCEDAVAVLAFATKPHAIQLYQRKDIDVLSAIPGEGLTEGFYRQRMPRERAALARLREQGFP